MCSTPLILISLALLLLASLYCLYSIAGGLSRYFKNPWPCKVLQFCPEFHWYVSKASWNSYKWAIDGERLHSCQNMWRQICVADTRGLNKKILQYISILLYNDFAFLESLLSAWFLISSECYLLATKRREFHHSTESGFWY